MENINNLPLPEVEEVAESQPSRWDKVANFSRKFGVLVLAGGILGGGAAYNALQPADAATCDKNVDPNCKDDDKGQPSKSTLPNKSTTTQGRVTTTTQGRVTTTTRNVVTVPTTVPRAETTVPGTTPTTRPSVDRTPTPGTTPSAGKDITPTL